MEFIRTGKELAKKNWAYFYGIKCRLEIVNITINILNKLPVSDIV